MGYKIACIPADDDGNKLFLKEKRMVDGRLMIKYRSTYNDIPFMDVELHSVDGGSNYAITGDDGTVMWRFPKFITEGLEM